VVLQEIGSQATVDAASAVLQGDIGEVPAAIVIARRTKLLIQVNIALALAFNCSIAIAAATVGVPLWASVACDNLGLLLVLANSVWPLFWKVPACEGLATRAPYKRHSWRGANSPSGEAEL